VQNIKAHREKTDQITQAQTTEISIMKKIQLRISSSFPSKLAVSYSCFSQTIKKNMPYKTIREMATVRFLPVL